MHQMKVPTHKDRVQITKALVVLYPAISKDKRHTLVDGMVAIRICC